MGNDGLVKFLAKLYPACKQITLSGLPEVPPHFSLGSNFHINPLTAVIPRVFEADARVEQPFRLIVKTGAVAPAASPARIKSEFAHECGKATAKFKTAATGPQGLSGQPEQ